MIYHHPADVPWPATPDGDYARRYLSPLMTDGPTRYIPNVRAQVGVWCDGDHVLPFTLTEQYDPHNSYVCSPFNHYLVYGFEELDKLGNPRLEAAIRALLTPLKAAFRLAAFDQVVMINNWLLSTNLWPDLPPEKLSSIVSAFVTAYPRRALVFRSLDDHANPHLAAALDALGCRRVFSRKVYYRDLESAPQRSNFKQDHKLYRRTPYQLTAHITDAARIAELYAMLYLGKYSQMNPQFSAAFIQHMLDHDLMTFRGFVRDERLDAVLGYFQRRGIMTQPIFGHDTNLPRDLGLYRLLSMQVYFEAIQNGCRVNSSAGVGAFKRLRGAFGVHEFNAVYTGHLPAWQRWPWATLQGLMDRAVVPVIDRAGF